MKVLILHQHFKTPQGGGAIRSYYLAKALTQSGIEVEVITGHDHNYKRERVEDFIVHYLKVPYNNSFGFLRRSFSFVKFIFGAARMAGECKKVDLTYAISVPLTVGIAARWIKKKHKIPYIFEVGDLWPDAPIQMGFVKNYFFKKWLFKVEHNIYRSALSIVALSPSIKTAIEKKIDGKRIDVIPNMADTEFFNKSSKDLQLERKYNTTGKFVVSYLGAIGVANGLEYLIACAGIVRKAGLPIQFILCGDGALKKKLEGEIENAELNNVLVLDFANREGVNEIMNITDASFICYQPVPILETGSPNKFFDALAAGKLVVVNFGGWIKNEIEENSCGIYVDPRQPADFVRKIKPFLDDRLLLENYQFNARSLGERKYSRQNLSREFSKLISESVSK